MDNYNQIKSEFRRHVIGSPEFKSLNSDLDEKTNNGETFEVDQEDQYSIMLYDVDKLIDDIKNRLPDNTEYIIIFIDSNFMGYDITLKCYINGKFEDIDEDKWDRLMTEIYDDADNLMGGYENAILHITYTTWLEMRKKTSKVILDINENVDNNTITRKFIKFITSLPEYHTLNKTSTENNGGYYYNELYNVDILKPIFNYPGKTEVPTNISHIIMCEYDMSFTSLDGYKKFFYVYDINDGFRIPTKKENEFIVKNDSALNLASSNYIPISKLDHDDWSKNQNRVNTLFNDINEDVFTGYDSIGNSQLVREVGSTMKKKFFEFTQKEFKQTNEYISKEIRNDEDGDIHNNECWLLDFNDINDVLDGDTNYNRYIIKTRFQDNYETNTKYYHYVDGDFKLISNEMDTEDLENGEVFGSDYQDVYDNIFYYSFSDYEKLNNKVNTLFNDINENVITKFEKFKKHYYKKWEN